MAETDISPYQQVVIDEADRLGLDRATALALIGHESAGFNPQAVSPTGVTGLGQVTIPTGRPYGQTPETRTDPYTSVRAGLGYFSDLLHGEAQGDVGTALRMYNAGPQGASEGKGDPQFANRIQAQIPFYQTKLKAWGVPAMAPPSDADLKQGILQGTQPQAAPGATDDATLKAGILSPQAPGVPAQPSYVTQYGQPVSAEEAQQFSPPGTPSEGVTARPAAAWTIAQMGAGVIAPELLPLRVLSQAGRASVLLKPLVSGLSQEAVLKAQQAAQGEALTPGLPDVVTMGGPFVTGAGPILNTLAQWRAANAVQAAGRTMEAYSATAGRHAMAVADLQNVISSAPARVQAELQGMLDNSTAFNSAGDVALDTGKFMTQVQRRLRDPSFQGEFSPGQLRTLQNAMTRTTGLPPLLADLPEAGTIPPHTWRSGLGGFSGGAALAQVAPYALADPRRAALTVGLGLLGLGGVHSYDTLSRWLIQNRYKALENALIGQSGPGMAQAVQYGASAPLSSLSR